VTVSQSQARWAAKTVLELTNTVTTNAQIDAFLSNPQESSRWIKAILAQSIPQTGNTTNEVYLKAVSILQQYGVDTNIRTP